MSRTNDRPVVHWAEVKGIEWERPDEMDGHRAVRVVVGDGKRRVTIGLCPHDARSLARDLRRSAKWCDEGLEGL